MLRILWNRKVNIELHESRHFVSSVSWKRYAVKRLLYAIPVFFGVILLCFALIHLAPGDPAQILAGEMSTPEYVEMLRDRFHLNKPLYEQLFIYVSLVIRGDLGRSFVYQQAVIEIIAHHLPATILLMGTSLILSSVVGVILGAVSSRRHSLADNLSAILSLIGFSVPSFWLGMILLILFAVQMRLFPIQGMISIGAELSGIDYIIDLLRHMALPLLTLIIIQLPSYLRLTRESMIEMLKRDFVTMERSVGLDEKSIRYKHALKNSLRSAVSLLGSNFGYIIMHSVLVEIIFSWPGIGNLLYNMLFARDYPVLMGILIVTTIMVIIGNTISDIIYTFIDPRVTYR